MDTRGQDSLDSEGKGRCWIDRCRGQKVAHSGANRVHSGGG